MEDNPDFQDSRICGCTYCSRSGRIPVINTEHSPTKVFCGNIDQCDICFCIVFMSLAKQRNQQVYTRCSFEPESIR